jgi:hypothetical protein
MLPYLKFGKGITTLSSETIQDEVPAVPANPYAMGESKGGKRDSPPLPSKSFAFALIILITAKALLLRNIKTREAFPHFQLGPSIRVGL